MSVLLPRRFPRRNALASALVAFALAGCANDGVERLSAFRQDLAQGDPRRSLETVRKNVKLYDSGSDPLYALDLGVLHHFAGQWDSSIYWLDKADNLFEDLHARSVSNEAAALVVNDNVRPYRFRAYERVFLSQLQLVGRLAKGDQDGALVEARRGVILLNELNSKGVNGQHGEAMLETLHWLTFQSGGESDNSVVSLRRSLAAWQGSKLPMPDPLKADAAFRLRSEGFNDEISRWNLSPSAAQLDSSRNLEQSPAEIVVVCYQGRSPVIDQMRAWGTWLKTGMFSYYYNNPATGKQTFNVLPVPGVPGSGRTFSVNFTLPILKETISQVGSVTASVDQGPSVATQPIFDTRDLLGKAVEEEEPAIMARTVVRVATRTLAAQKAKSAIRTGNPLVDLLTNVGMDVAQGQIEQSDVRMSIWLPRQVRILRIPVQAGVHSLRLQARNSAGIVIGEKQLDSLQVAKGAKRFVPVAFAY
ncbi:MAG: hypothetical protein IPN71_07700 [Fibrobacteres bacterium]|nr:hypothetical protein [Fibrobacterota bacterium]